MIYFHFRDAAYLRDVVSKVRLSEKKTKRILSFLEREYLKTKFKGSMNQITGSHPLVLVEFFSEKSLVETNILVNL